MYMIMVQLQVMVATVRCEEIANEKYASFTANEVYLDIWEDFIYLFIGVDSTLFPQQIIMVQSCNYITRRNGVNLMKQFSLMLCLALGRSLIQCWVLV